MDRILYHPLTKLPLTVEGNLHLTDPAVSSFLRRLQLCYGDEVYDVIDHMFVFYTSCIDKYQEELKHIHERLTSEDLKRLKSE